MTRWQHLRLWWARYFGTLVTLRATDGARVRVHPDFAVSYWRDPGLWQGVVDAQAEKERDEWYRRR